MTDAKAIRNSVEGRDVPRGPSATQLHDRAIRTAIDRAIDGRELHDLRSAKAYLEARGWTPEPEGESVFEDGAA